MIFLYGYFQKLLAAVGSSQMGVTASLMISLLVVHLIQVYVVLWDLNNDCPSTSQFKEKLQRFLMLCTLLIVPKVAMIEIFPCSVFHTFFDQYHDIWRTALINLVIAFGAVFVVSLVITCSLWSSAIILLVLAMIVVDLMVSSGDGDQ